MPVTNLDLKKCHPLYRLNDEAAGNGGRPAHPLQPIMSGAPANVFPELFQVDLASGKSILRKLFVFNLNADNIALQYPEECIFTPPETVNAKVYTYFYIGTQDGTAADDVEATSEKYGAGVIVSHPAANSFVVDFLHLDLIPGGTNELIKVGKRIRPDKRTTYGGAGEFESPALIVDTITGTSGTQVSFTTTTDAQYTYSAGDILQTLPDLDAIQVKAEVESVDKTSLTTTTFDENAIIAYNKFCPRQIMAFEVESTTTFKVETDVLGWENSGSLLGGHLMSAAFEPVNTDPAYNGVMLTVPENTFGGTPVAGEIIYITLKASCYAVWQRLEVLAGASSETKTIVTGSGGQSVS